MALVSVPEEDEFYLTRVAPKQIGRLNAICGGALVCHFAFNTQRDHLEKTALLSHYKTVMEGGAMGINNPKVSAYPVEKMRICFFTADRFAQGRMNYITSSLTSLSHAAALDADRLPVVDLIIDGPSSDWIDDSPIPVRCHPIPQGEWEEKSKWNVHRRISYSYHRCFELALADPNCPGILILEDDVMFREGFLPKLQAVLDELAEVGKRWFCLSLYTVGDLDGRDELDMGELFGIYPEWFFWGGQGVYFSRDCIEDASRYWKRRGWQEVEYSEDANDRLVGRFGHSLWRQYGHAGGHFRAYRDLVQHTGEVTTGMSTFYHFSDTFERPWPGEETAGRPQGRPVFSEVAAWRHNPRNVALSKEKTVIIPLPGAGDFDIMRALGRYIGASVGGEPDGRNVELPTMLLLPSEWTAVSIVRDPALRLLKTFQTFTEMHGVSPSIATTLTTLGRLAIDTPLLRRLRKASFSSTMTLTEFLRHTLLLRNSDIHSLPRELWSQVQLIDEAFGELLPFSSTDALHAKSETLRVFHYQNDLTGAFSTVCRAIGIAKEIWFPKQSAESLDGHLLGVAEWQDILFKLCAEEVERFSFTPKILLNHSRAVWLSCKGADIACGA